MTHRIATPDERDITELRLHDDTVQALFGLGLRLEICQEFVARREQDEAQHALDSALATLDQVIESIRDRIYGLERHPPSRL